ncbi:putative 3-dehydroshikimate dehydratase [Venustampulla echinocandica]|uniref:Putative 3-dehydroshikimate dehydratase n=1 Tax=Venustampulla echinocandica TaxID=2656787 RepID=A0A370TBQ2_9HELO|nr:putative 3-dehydroshikimate dehydratase [Venustampulla echinocandica]RDL31484.1 putative 3-dehydroshikimate dehydratase [Venustampulla echinocandica]
MPKISYRPALASHSLGRACVHGLPEKFTAAANAGLPGIEIFFEDLLYLADTFPGGSSLPRNQILAARQIRSLSDSLSLTIMALGPFSDCEGLLSPTARARAAKLQKLRTWFEIARILGTDIIQIPSTFQTEGMTADMDVIVQDLREIAALGARETPPIRFAYENLCFATFNDTWDKAWSVVKNVDRENFGLCLDTFNIAGSGWADPAARDGKRENADRLFKESLRRFVAEVDVRKVFYVQAVDAERLESPLDETHPFFVEGQRPRMSWSRNARLFVCEQERGGYLPVVDVLKAICDSDRGLGYSGWISMEYFNRSLFEQGAQVPEEHARRAVQSWQRLVKIMGWEEMEEDLSKKPTTMVNKVGGKKLEAGARL